MGLVHDTAIVGLWVPVVVFAHLFAGFWFLKTFLLYDPRPLAALRRKSSSNGKTAKTRISEGDESKEDGTEDIVLTLAKRQSADNAVADDAVEVNKGRTNHGTSGRLSRVPSEMYDDESHEDNSFTKVERVHLQWQKLSCTYNAPAGKIVVLQDIWGHAAPGEMQALLGPSGAGKSTLMDILAQRKSMGNLNGFLLLNGRPATSSFIRKTAYVPQDDNFVATMTVAEVMNFYADIILPKTWTKADRRARVAEVLAAMGLRHKHSTMVGGTLPGGLMLRGLSGGERKRLSIAAGILAAPSVVFLDEPTSGLDSFAALTVMGYLKRMARDSGHVVIASIHQPRSAIWSMFDKVTLLASGRLMFHGARDDLVPWFGHLGYTYDPALHGVASDWALDLVAIGFHKPKRFYGHTITNMEELTRASNEFSGSYTSHSGVMPYAGGSESMIGSKSISQKVQARMNKLVGVCNITGNGSSAAGGADGSNIAAVDSSVGQLEPKDLANLTQVLSKQSKWATGWWRHFASCYGRELLSITRNPADVAGRTMTFAWVAILMGLLYYGMPEDAASIRGRLNLVFNILSFFCLMPYVSMSLYSADKRFYIADASAKLYRPLAYYMAKVAATTPFQVITALVFTFIVYGMAGLRDGGQFIWQNGVISTMLSLIAVQVLHCCAILAPNQDVAFMLSIVWTAIQLLMSNFFITFTEVVFQWLTMLRWVSALYYAFEGLAVAEFGNMTFPCDQGMDQAGLTFLKTLLPKSRFLNMPIVADGLQNPGADCIADTNAALTYYGFNRPFGHTFGILLGYLVITHIITYTIMIIVARREHR
eukprot:GHRR01017850.1.p1 GENE.GHRR01017850.1~~GHRR01017850.1.p1  ORF type:complete len:820 (+),score=223.92 GHRR01017850.1:95-2554(+)